MIPVREEGLWPKDYTPYYENMLDWGTADFVKALKRKEEDTHKLKFKAESKCRICNALIGGSVHVDDDVKQNVEWHWPEGYLHYIKRHFVVPSYEFRCFILNQKLQIQATDYKPPKKRFYFLLRKSNV